MHAKLFDWGCSQTNGQINGTYPPSCGGGNKPGYEKSILCCDDYSLAFIFICSDLKLESKCLARYEEDGLWYKAIVVEVLEDHKFQVMFDSYNNTETVSIEDILPSGRSD